MRSEQVLEIFRACGAILHGHFILSSGLHASIYLQKALVFQYPDKTEQLCKALSAKILGANLGEITKIVSPALGGIIPGYETARHLNIPALWVERYHGELRLRRGFELGREDRVVVVEDIVTTGLSSRQTVATITRHGAMVEAVACLIDRSGGKADLGAPLLALSSLDIPSYSPEDIPDELKHIPAVKPGGRNP